ncbi:hypothetical protein NQ314_009590 [Rhamnusium bicolor]|uniref:Kinesin motor domain-containing protein n=1 Tax=Rhamnusium bicolor TaxID=1586634 RepID=A0AAV8XXT5_9CUCU|nr:hypothetical protein NQ314_009590 [Rhamnusium bicolor]
MNPCRDMFDETHHVLNFSAIAKEILIEEQPKIIKPKKTNRFSQYMDRKTASIPPIQEVEEDEKDIEINKLKLIITELYTEIEHQKAEYELEQKLERDHIISGYKQIIEDIKEKFEEQKVRALSKVKIEYEEKIKLLNNHYSKLLEDQSDVISIDSSSDEDDSYSDNESPKKAMRNLENIISEQNNKIKLLQQELCEVQVEKERLQREIQVIPKLKEQIKVLKEEQIDYFSTLSAAEEAYSDLQTELREFERKNKKLISEKLQLKEKVDQLEELLSHANDNTDEVESTDVCNNH